MKKRIQDEDDSIKTFIKEIIAEMNARAYWEDTDRTVSIGEIFYEMNKSDEIDGRYIDYISKNWNSYFAESDIWTENSLPFDAQLVTSKNFIKHVVAIKREFSGSYDRADAEWVKFLSLLIETTINTTKKLIDTPRGDVLITFEKDFHSISDFF